MFIRIKSKGLKGPLGLLYKYGYTLGREKLHIQNWKISCFSSWLYFQVKNIIKIHLLIRETQLGNEFCNSTEKDK